MDQKTETEIVVRILNGDRQAYALLVEEYKLPIYNLAYRMTHSIEDAEDLAQETFLSAFRALARYDTNRRFYTWLYTISLNLIRNHLKRTGRKKTDLRNIVISSGMMISDSETFTSDRNHSTDESMSEREDKLETGLRKLSPDLHEILVLRFYQRLSFEAIAEITGISTSAVKMRVYRGLEKLRKYIQKM